VANPIGAAGEQRLCRHPRCYCTVIGVVISDRGSKLRFQRRRAAVPAPDEMPFPINSFTRYLYTFSNCGFFPGRCLRRGHVNAVDNLILSAILLRARRRAGAAERVDDIKWPGQRVDWLRIASSSGVLMFPFLYIHQRGCSRVGRR